MEKSHGMVTRVAKILGLSWVLKKIESLGSKKKKRAAWFVLATVLAGGFWLATYHGSNAGWKNWWDWQTFSGTRSDQVTSNEAAISISEPAPPRYDGDDKDGKPHPVILNFSVSAAPLALVGKEAEDVKISPALAGKWTWSAANRLEFLPDQDWPIGEQFKVILGTKALAPHVSLDNTVHFQSPRFSLNIRSASFYQDPVQVTLRKAVFEINFSHPVNPESFEKHLHLEADKVASGFFSNVGDTRKFTVTYDKNRMSATVLSEPLPIPATAASLTLVVSTGTMAQRGGNAQDSEIRQAVSIPGLYNLDITELGHMIVTGDNGEPESVLHITAGMPVRQNEMGRAINVWLLPPKHLVKDTDQETKLWSNPDDVTDEVLKQAKPIVLSHIPSEREINETHDYKWLF